MRPRRRNCSTCRHGEQTHYAAHGKTLYLCRRRSPVPNPMDTLKAAKWPQVTEDDWCSEYGPDSSNRPVQAGFVSDGNGNGNGGD